MNLKHILATITLGIIQIPFAILALFVSILPFTLHAVPYILVAAAGLTCVVGLLPPPTAGAGAAYDLAVQLMPYAAGSLCLVVLAGSCSFARCILDDDCDPDAYSLLGAWHNIVNKSTYSVFRYGVQKPYVWIIHKLKGEE